MELKEQIRINAHRNTVYKALNDVEILRQAIPGCEVMERISDTEFKAVVVSKVGPMKAKFTGGVTLSDLDPPVSYTMTGEGKGGAAGFAKMRAHVRLEEDGEATLMRYEVKADVGGKLAQLGGRLIEGTSKKLAGEFFGNLEKLIGGPGGEEPAAVAGSTSAGEGRLLFWFIAAALIAAAVVCLTVAF